MDIRALPVESFLTFTLAIVLLFIGKRTVARFALLKRYSIPDPVIGGFICATIAALVYYGGGIALDFDTETRDRLLLYFFAAVGLRANLKMLISGGKPLLILLTLATSFIFLQNLTGMGIAELFGYESKLGLMIGSISLTGGVGTTIAWEPYFTNNLGMSHASEVGIGANTLGLIFACLIGGPIARFLIQRHNLRGEVDAGSTGNLEVGISHNQPLKNFDYMSLLFAWLIIHLSLILGYFLDILLSDLGLKLPLFVSCLIGGIVIGNIGPLLVKRFNAPENHMGLALMADMSLGLFLTMALMSMKLWLLSGMFGFILTAVALQALLTVLFSLFLVFPLMGKDYEASVIAAGFGGITLGSTATAIVNMKSVAEEYGPAHRAFIIVPLVCGFFIDLVNALVIGYFLG